MGAQVGYDVDTNMITVTVSKNGHNTVHLTAKEAEIFGKQVIALVETIKKNDADSLPQP